MAHNLGDVMLHEVTIAFSKAYILASKRRDESEAIRNRLQAQSTTWYDWYGGQITWGESDPVPQEDRSVLAEFHLTERFFLAKQYFSSLTEVLGISRYLLRARLRLVVNTVHPVGRERGSEAARLLEFDSVRTIVSMYRIGESHIMTVAFWLPDKDYALDDVIFLKNLKWYSRPADQSEATHRCLCFCAADSAASMPTDLKSMGELFHAIKKAFDTTDAFCEKDASDLIFDAIQFKASAEELTDVELFGLIVGDEGYCLVAPAFGNGHPPAYVTGALQDGETRFQGRQYFTYFFSPTSVVAQMSRDYPADKQRFAREYIERYGSLEPLTNYIGLNASMPALSDGVYLFCDLVQARYLLFLDLNRQLHELPRELEALLALEDRIAPTLEDISTLTESDLWLNIMTSSKKMFSGETVEKHMQERLQSLHNRIRSRYDERTNEEVIRLAQRSLDVARSSKRWAVAAGIVGN